MTNHRLDSLFTKYINRTASDDEERELMEFVRGRENGEEVKRLIDRLIDDMEVEVKLPEKSANEILRNILQSGREISSVKVRSLHSYNWTRLLVAASIVLFITGVIYWTLNIRSHERAEFADKAERSVQILADKDATTLTLYDGTVIELKKLSNGVHIWRDVKLEKKDDLLMFAQHHQSSEISVGTGALNILSTSPGKQYRIELPDKTNVWLNASSSLIFPIKFDTDSREVTLKGEAYFDVVRSETTPFRVGVGNMYVRVLGTQFNINSYEDESTVKTSLLTGKVELIRGEKSEVLKPGQQEIYDKKENKGQIQNVDMEEVVAWKDGLFSFDGEDIKTIMGQIGRWYDVEVSFIGNKPTRRFEGKISRSAPLLDVLKVLELSGVKFSVDGKKVTVYTEE